MCLLVHTTAGLVSADGLHAVGLPGFPTLLSAEGDFLIKAGSIHVTHNTFNNTTQSRGRKYRRLTTSQPEKGAKET